MWSVDFEGEGIFCMKKIILKLCNTKKTQKYLSNTLAWIFRWLIFKLKIPRPIMSSQCEPKSQKIGMFFQKSSENKIGVILQSG